MELVFLRSVRIRSENKVSLVSASPMTPAEENDLDRSALDFLFYSFSFRASSWLSNYFLTFYLFSRVFKSLLFIISFTFPTVAFSLVFSATWWNIFSCFCLICIASIFSYYFVLLIFFFKGLSAYSVGGSLIAVIVAAEVKISFILSWKYRYLWLRMDS